MPSKGTGEYYHIILNDKNDFVTFRYHDVGDPGKILRLAGKKENGAWADHAWLIDKKMAHVEKGYLVADDKEAKELLENIGPAKQKSGDEFNGHAD